MLTEETRGQSSVLMLQIIQEFCYFDHRNFVKTIVFHWSIDRSSTNNRSYIKQLGLDQGMTLKGVFDLELGIRY